MPPCRQQLTLLRCCRAPHHRHGSACHALRVLLCTPTPLNVSLNKPSSIRCSANPGSHRILLSVRNRIHGGMGRFCRALRASFFLMMKVFWLGCRQAGHGGVVRGEVSAASASTRLLLACTHTFYRPAGQLDAVTTSNRSAMAALLLAASRCPLPCRPQQQPCRSSGGAMHTPAGRASPAARFSAPSCCCRSLERHGTRAAPLRRPAWLAPGEGSRRLPGRRRCCGGHPP